MILTKKLSNKSFAVYGLGATGKSVINFFERRGIKKISTFDDLEEKKRVKIQFGH